MSKANLFAAYAAALKVVNPSAKSVKSASVEYTMTEYAASERGKAMLAKETAEMQLLAKLGLGSVLTSADISVAPDENDHIKDLWSVDFNTLSGTTNSEGNKIFERRVASALQCKHSNVSFWGVPARPVSERDSKFPQPKVFYSTAVAFTSSSTTVMSYASAAACELFEDATAPVMELYRQAGSAISKENTIATYQACDALIQDACLKNASSLKINKDMSYNAEASKKQFRLVMVNRIDTTENNVKKLDLTSKAAF